jgi:hypothetical protein
VILVSQSWRGFSRGGGAILHRLPKAASTTSESAAVTSGPTADDDSLPPRAAAMGKRLVVREIRRACGTCFD